MTRPTKPEDATRQTRDVLNRLDDAISAVAEIYGEAREKIGGFYTAVAGSDDDRFAMIGRGEEFQMLQYLVPNMLGMILYRLAWLEPRLSIPNVSGNVDREQPCPSAREKFEPVLSLIAPPPGRPKKRGAADTPPIADEPKQEPAE